MNLRTKITLNLPSQENKTVLEYSTYELAKWDQYFIATLVNNTNSKTEASDYIDRLTNKGVFNSYFKSLLDEVIVTKEKSPEVFQHLLDSSLYPTSNLDIYQWFYIPLLKISLLKKKNKIIDVFSDKLSDDEDKITKNDQVFKDLLSSDETFISVKNSLNNKNSLTMHDLYEVDLQDDRVKVKLLDDWYPLDLETFSEILESEKVDFDNFQGKIISEPTGENWRILDNQIFSDFFKQKKHFYDQEQDENLYLIEDNGLVKIEIYNYSGKLYLYRRTFSKYDTEKALKTINFLLISKQIYEVKTKMLLLLLNLVNDKLAHKVINEILANRDSRELAEYGLKLIENNLTSDWKQTVLKKIKQATSTNKMLLIYKIDSSIFDFDKEYSIIMNFPDNILNEEHHMKKKQYINNKNKLEHEINLLIGKITNSGVREKIKDLKSNDLVKRFKKFLNSYVGHTKEDYSKMPLEKITKEYKKILYSYNNDYPQIMKMIENKTKIKKQVD